MITRDNGGWVLVAEDGEGDWVLLQCPYCGKTSNMAGVAFKDFGSMKKHISKSHAAARQSTIPAGASDAEWVEHCRWRSLTDSERSCLDGYFSQHSQDNRSPDEAVAEIGNDRAEQSSNQNVHGGS